jgi:uncharacterized protein
VSGIDHRALLVAPLLAMAFLASPPARALPPPPVTLPRTEVRLVRAAANGVAYRLDVSLPRGFAQGGRGYPLIVVLDSDYAFPVVRAVVEHLSDRGWIPESVIVGVGYQGATTTESYRRNRTRDYTPIPFPTGGYGPEFQKISGGGLAFERFLVEELLPIAARDYRATGDRVLVGHSYGGLLASHVLLDRPGAFQGFVVVSPSLWYADRFLLGRARGVLATREDLQAIAYLAVGAREGNAERDMQEDLRAFHDLLSARALPGFRSRLEVLPDETHDSVFPAAVSNGLRYVLRERAVR